MPARPHRRHRVIVALVGTILAAGLLSSCAGQREPGSYTSGVKDQIVNGCVDQGKKDKAAGKEGKDFWSTSECKCAMEAIVKDIPFKEFHSINTAQINQPTQLPEDFLKVIDPCNN